MLTKKNLVKLAVVLIAGTALLFAGENCSAGSDDLVNMQGVVSVTKDADDAITAVTFTAKNGTVYNVTLDENGKKLGEELADKKVLVEGTVSEEDGQKYLTVQYYASEEEPAA